jgi:hypothetical protein
MAGEKDIIHETTSFRDMNTILGHRQYTLCKVVDTDTTTPPYFVSPQIPDQSSFSHSRQKMHFGPDYYSSTICFNKKIQLPTHIDCPLLEEMRWWGEAARAALMLG